MSRDPNGLPHTTSCVRLKCPSDPPQSAGWHYRSEADAREVAERLDAAGECGPHEVRPCRDRLAL